MLHVNLDETVVTPVLGPLVLHQPEWLACTRKSLAVVIDIDFQFEATKACVAAHLCQPLPKCSKDRLDVL